jgi:hypothetical protein
MSYAKAAFFCILLTARWVLAPSGLSTMHHTKATLFYTLLTARWVFAPTMHHAKKHKSNIISLSLSLYRSLFNL